MSRSKLLLENFLVYGLGSVINKIIPFIMLPVITRLIRDTSYYGLNDIVNVMVSFGSALAIMGMYDAMFRMFFEHEELEYKKKVCSSALVTVLMSGCGMFVMLVVFRNFFGGVFFGSSKYMALVLIGSANICLNSITSIVSAPTRMQNKRAVFLIINTVSPLVGYSISIPMLLHGEYLLALPIASFTSALILLTTFAVLNHKWFGLKKVDTGLIKLMLKIGLPLVPTFLFYWIFSSFDRMMVSKILGANSVGIYGVGARVASVSQFIYAAFAGGWQYFAFSTMKDKDHVDIISKVYEYLGLVSFLAIIVATPFTNILFNILFTGDYVKGAIVFPYLLISPLLLMLFQTSANQFVVIKKTWPTGVALLLGAISSITLGYFLTHALGIEGAAIATFSGYTISTVIVTVILLKINLIKLTKRFLYAACITFAYIVLSRVYFSNSFVSAVSASLLMLVFLTILYMKDLKILINKLKSSKTRIHFWKRKNKISEALEN